MVEIMVETFYFFAALSIALIVLFLFGAVSLWVSSLARS